MKNVIILVLICFSLLACKKEHAKRELAPPNACGEQNSISNPCPVSPYLLLADSASFNGKFIDVLLYAPGGNTKLVFLAKNSAEYDDYVSSIQIVSGMEKLPQEAGYVRVVGNFYNDTSDRGVGGGLHRQFGVFREIVSVTHVKSVTERREECKVPNCNIVYDDGSHVID
jgi:hypothetical protein